LPGKVAAFLIFDTPQKTNKTPGKTNKTPEKHTRTPLRRALLVNTARDEKI